MKWFLHKIGYYRVKRKVKRRLEGWIKHTKRKVIIWCGGVWRENALSYRYTENKEQMLYELVELAKKAAIKDHKEYRATTLDRYFLASFAKRFITIWVDQIDSGKNQPPTHLNKL